LGGYRVYPPMSSYPTELDRIMSKEGRSSAWLADVCAVNDSTVLGWRRGNFIPEKPKRLVVARVLGRKLSELRWTEAQIKADREAVAA